MSNLVTSWLRTVVPGLWSALVTALLAWAATSAPWLINVMEALHIDLASPTAAAVVMALVLAAWHGVWRKVEPYIPDWLARVVLGSAAQPVYVTPADRGTALRLADGGRAKRTASTRWHNDPPEK
jgi:hypothetical protein